jgi:hypothetical protein
MRKCSLLVLGCCLLLSGCGGKPTIKSSMQDYLKIMNEMNDVLVTVKDKPSADAAKPKLDALAQRMKTVVDGMSSITTGSKEEMESAMKELQPQMKAASEKLGQTLQNVQDPEIKKKAMDIMMELLTVAMKKAQTK